MRVLMVTQMLDYNHPILGFTHAWVQALNARVERLIVVPVEEGEYDLPGNIKVVSMGKEHGRRRLGRAATFYGTLLQYLPEVDVIFAHMCPRYVLAAAPLAVLYRKPITLWFTHRQRSLELRLAIPWTRHIATAHPTSFPFASPKVRALGHGIDTITYQPDDDLPPDPPMVLSLARLSPIKRHETLIQAAAILRDRYGDPPARFVIAGGTPGNGETAYPDFLRAEIERLRVGDRVSLWGAIPADGVAAVFREARLALNASPPGLFDKAALEGMLCGVPTLVANPAFDDLLGDHAGLLRIPSGDDAPALAERLAALLRMTPEERRAIGLDIRARVAAGHSLDGLMDRLVALMAE